GQGDEDLAAVGDDAGASGRGQSGVTDAGGVVEQGLQVVATGVQQDFGLGQVQRFAVPDPGQCAPHGGGRRDRFLVPVSRTTHGRTIRVGLRVRGRGPLVCPVPSRAASPILPYL